MGWRRRRWRQKGKGGRDTGRVREDEGVICGVRSRQTGSKARCSGTGHFSATSLLDIQMMPSAPAPFVHHLLHVVPASFIIHTPHFCIPPLQGQIPKLSLVWHTTPYREVHTHTTLSFCTFSMCVSGPCTSPTAGWQGPAVVFVNVCLCVLARAHEIPFYLTTVPIPADSAGIRFDFLCQQQPPSFIPPVFSFLLLSSGCSGWVWGET